MWMNEGSHRETAGEYFGDSYKNWICQSWNLCHWQDALQLTLWVLGDVHVDWWRWIAGTLLWWIKDGWKADHGKKTFCWKSVSTGILHLAFFSLCALSVTLDMWQVDKTVNLPKLITIIYVVTELRMTALSMIWENVAHFKPKMFTLWLTRREVQLVRVYILSLCVAEALLQGIQHYAFQPQAVPDKAKPLYHAGKIITSYCCSYCLKYWSWV